MTTYIIFIKAPIDLRKTYYQNSRRGERGISITGSRAEMLRKVEELKATGELVLSVRTALGNWVNF